MKENAAAREVVRAFCQAWLTMRDPEQAQRYLAEDVVFVGLGRGHTARGAREMERVLLETLQEVPETFQFAINLLYEQRIREGIWNLSAEMVINGDDCVWNLRAIFTVAQESDSALRIQTMHFSSPSKGRHGGEHDHQARVQQNVLKQREELMWDSLPGGMMGGYIDPGFPFYFINGKMLSYLGYADEQDFIEDIGGLIGNCMHPDDRRTVDEEVSRQLKEGNGYIAEYRMRKKDGSYIWVHDVGKMTIAEDGRPAIISVCMDITAQKQAREEVMNLYNNIPGAVFRCRFDEDFSVIDANDGLFEFLGYTREEFAEMGNRMSSVIHPEDLKGMAAKLNGQLEHSNSIHNENRLICKDGTIKWISIKGQLFQEGAGEQHFYCVFVDITDEMLRRRREKDLYEQEMAYFAELSSAEGCVQGRANVSKNVLESYSTVSNVALARAGESLDEALESLAASAVDPGRADELRRTFNRKMMLSDYAIGKVNYHFDFLRRRNDGGAFWGSTSFRTCLNPETGDIIAFFHTLDITAKKIQEQLLDQLAKLDYDIITEIDIPRGIHHHLVSYDESCKNIIPQTGGFQEGISQVACQYMTEASRAEYLKKLDFAYMEKQLAQQDSYSFVVEMKDANGEQRVKKIRIFYINRELKRVCMTRADVTDVVRQEQRQKEDLAAALVAAEQANAAKSDFLSRMSHEIRTPMNAIIGMSAIAAQHPENVEMVTDCISKIGISSRFLLSLINDILDMSRIESGKMLLKNEEIPLEEFLNGINSICYDQAAAKGVEYECIVDPVLDDCYMGDAMKLQQVLINILSNAIKFTGESGKVTFAAALRQRRKDHAVLRFVVNDTGVGMSEDFLPHIFEPFSQEYTGTTALYGGTGLGLAISKNLVDMMDGKIVVRSIKGIGTEFTVDVKLGVTEEEKLRHRQKKHDYNFSHLKTLVVDDDVAVCESTVVILKEIGVTAEWVDSGRKAVELVRSLWAQGKHYDMILIDWKMPEMDGIETAQRIRSIVGQEVTIIIITAYDWISIEHEAKLAGVNLLISKPMFKSSLISAFARALGEKEEQSRRMEDVDYDFSGRRALLVEDNSLNTEVAKLLLENKGFSVDTAQNGLRALEIFSKSEKGHYDVILMDIRMPLMDGLTAANSIRHLSNADAGAIPIVAMTANAFEEDVEKSKAAGMNAHLAKPIDPKRLYETLYDLIYGKEV